VRWGADWAESEHGPAPWLTLARWSLLPLVASLPLMKLSVFVAGLPATATDALFLVSFGLWSVALVRGECRLHWHPFFLVLGIYVAALALSVSAASDVRASLIKLATQAYLVGLPVLVYGLVGSETWLRRVLMTWLAATAVPALVGTATVAAFYLGVDRTWLDSPLHSYGTLVPGNYPRLETTFFYPAMLCNYLTVAVFVLLFARRTGWIGRPGSAALLATTVITAAFSLTPGLGGFVLALTAWVYWSASPRLLRNSALAAGIGACAASVVVAAVTPVIYPSVPYLITLPGLGLQLAPAVRMLTWTAAASAFLARPLFGSGIGVPSFQVRFVVPAGDLHVLDDAHNVYLNIAAQSGIVGLAALLLLIGYVALESWRFRDGGARSLSWLLGLAWIDAFAIQGFTGSYEDARHLWVLLGLWLASIRMESGSRQPQGRIGAELRRQAAIRAPRYIGSLSSQP
jgi:hypothetical protein